MKDKLQKICQEIESSPRNLAKSDDELREQIHTAEMLSHEKSRFLNGDKLSLLLTVSTSNKMDFGLPRWAQQEIASVFDEYIESDGQKKMPELFGVAKGKGKGNCPFRKHREVAVRYSVNHCVYFLHKIVGFKLEVCFLILAGSGITYTDISGGVGETWLSASRICDLYRREKRPANPDIFKETNVLETFHIHFGDAFFAFVGDGTFDQHDLLDSVKSTYKNFFESHA